MILETKFNIHDRVLISEINKVGLIKSIFYNGAQISYNIRYFSGDSAQEAYFYEDELTLEAKKEALGFQV